MFGIDAQAIAASMGSLSVRKRLGTVELFANSDVYAQPVPVLHKIAVSMLRGWIWPQNAIVRFRQRWQYLSNVSRFLACGSARNDRRITMLSPALVVGSTEPASPPLAVAAGYATIGRFRHWWTSIQVYQAGEVLKRFACKQSSRRQSRVK